MVVAIIVVGGVVVGAIVGVDGPQQSPPSDVCHIARCHGEHRKLHSWFRVDLSLMATDISTWLMAAG